MQRTHSIVETLITYTAIIVLALGAATACSTDVRLGGRDSTEPSGDAGPASDSTASADSTTQPDALPSADSTPADDAAATSPSWRKLTAPTSETLTAVWGSGPNDVYVVGRRKTILRYDGKTWSPQPWVAPTAADALAVWGSGPSDVYVVGTWGTLLHFDGTSWTHIDPGLTVLPDVVRFESVWGTGPNDVYVAGYWSGFQGGTPLFIAIAYHFDGTSWSEYKLQTATVHPMFHGIAGASSKDMVIVGNPRIVSGGPLSFVSLIIENDGNAWSMSEPKDFEVRHGLNAVHVGQQRAFVAGDQGLVATRAGGPGNPWTHEPTPVTITMFGIWASADGSAAYAVGQSGTLLERDSTNGSWSNRGALGSSEDLWGVWGSASDDVYAVGGNGLVLHFGRAP